MPKDVSTYAEDERVLCYHGPMIYEAKVLKSANMNEKDMQGPHYFVHYKGWKQTWDEWVPEERVLKWTEANLQKQIQLREAHNKKKPARSTVSSNVSDRAHDGESRGRKRARDSSMDKAKEDDMMHKPEMKLDIPEQLKGLLVDDWENVTKTQKLLPLPRNPTVSDILDDYLDHAMKSRKRNGESDELLNEVVRGIKLYFDKTLGSSLLYRMERKQYTETIVEADSDVAPSDVYGAEHLLRLFVQMPQLIASSNVDPDSAVLLKDYLADVLSYLQQEQTQLFTV